MNDHHALSQFNELLFDESLPFEKQVEIVATLSSITPTGEFLANCVLALRQYGSLFQLPDSCLDIVGTGGDGLNTFNISTTTALFLANKGVKVVKHGNRASSSSCGSIDLLDTLEIKKANSKEEVLQDLQEKNLSFVSAPDFYPVLLRLRPARQAIVAQGKKTIFHLLGPLAHPGQIKHQVIGVYNPQLLEPMAQALQLLGTHFSAVIHGQGADEWLLGEENFVHFVSATAIQKEIYSCRDFGINPQHLSKLAGGTAHKNALITKAILEGIGTQAQQDVVKLNAILAYYVAYSGKLNFDQCQHLLYD